MTFGNILGFILLGYIIYYAGMIIYELFIQPEALSPEKTEEEDLDISAIAGDFAPTRIDKNGTIKEAEPRMLRTTPSMDGALTAEELVAGATGIANDGAESLLGKIINAWEVQPLSASAN